MGGCVGASSAVTFLCLILWASCVTEHPPWDPFLEWESPPDRVTWDGLIGPGAEDLFDRISIDGEFLPARPISLSGLHIHKGLLVDGHDL